MPVKNEALPEVFKTSVDMGDDDEFCQAEQELGNIERDNAVDEEEGHLAHPSDELLPEAEVQMTQKAASIVVGLTREILRASLCSFEPTVDGIHIAPSKFICNRKSLTTIRGLERFHFLRYINLASNDLTDVSELCALPNLIFLNASSNRLPKMLTGKWPVLTHLLLDHNHIAELGQVEMPHLKVLSLNFNQLRNLVDSTTSEAIFTSRALPELHTLEIAHNKLYLLEGASPDDPTAPICLKLELPKLKALFLGHNELTSLATYKLCPKPVLAEQEDEMLAEHTEEERTVNDEDNSEMLLLLDEERSALGELPELSVLNLRSNGMRDMDGLGVGAFPKLQYLNLRENLITNPEELEKLRGISSLQTLILKDNPITDLKDYRIEVRATLRNLRRLDKLVYTPEEIEESDALGDERYNQHMAAEAF